MKTNVPVAAVVHAEMAEAIIASTGISYGDPKSIESSPSPAEMEAQEARNPECNLDLNKD